MRAVPLFIVLAVYGLSGSVAPELSVATDRLGPATLSAPSDDAEYLALQLQADLALDTLRQAGDRRMAAAILPGN